MHTYIRRFSVGRKANSNQASSKAQKKNSQELIAAYTSSYRSRKGFLSKGWNIVDLMSATPPSVINEGGQDGETVMAYYSEFCERSSLTRGGDSPGGDTSIWCPRIFSPVIPGPNFEVDGAVCEGREESQQSHCLGRAVVYQEQG